MIKSIQSINGEDISSVVVFDPDIFFMELVIDISLDNNKTSSLYEISVCSWKWIREQFVVFGKPYLYKKGMIVLDSYDCVRIEKEIELVISDIVDDAENNPYLKVAEHFVWEY